MTKQSIEQRIDKVRGSMLGGAIGDALGYQIEFERDIVPRSTTRFTDGIGMISDDTQMTLLTACGHLWRSTRIQNLGIAQHPSKAIY